MPKITLTNANVDFPVFDASARSLKKHVFRTMVGTKIAQRADGHVIVRGLDSITLTLQDGARLGLIGHNGAGKTTLLRVLNGIFVPTRGKAIIEGKCTSLINISLGIDPEATGRENIGLRGTLIGMTAREIDEQTDKIVEFTGLGEFIDMPLRTYSTGMQLRLAFAISTSVVPEILIMDEWLATGDAEFKQRANERMKAVVDSSNILVLASHSEDLIRKNCNRVIWLEKGRIKMDGAPDEVLSAYFQK
jgi:lipopolysaccharide transport system ATP-binding protein